MDIAGPIDFEKQQELIKKKLKALEKKTDSKIVQKINKEKEQSDDSDLQARMDMVHRVLRETMDSVREGEMTFDEGIKDFTNVIKNI